MRIIKEKIPQEIIDKMFPEGDCTNRNEELRLLVREIIRMEYLLSQKSKSNSNNSKMKNQTSNP